MQDLIYVVIKYNNKIYESSEFVINYGHTLNSILYQKIQMVQSVK